MTIVVACAGRAAAMARVLVTEAVTAAMASKLVGIAPDQPCARKVTNITPTPASAGPSDTDHSRA